MGVGLRDESGGRAVTRRLPVLSFGEEDGASDDDRDEGGDPDGAERADGKRFQEDRIPATIGRAFVSSVAMPAVVSALPALESRLQDESSDRVANHERGDEDDVATAVDGALRRDVSRCEQKPRRQTVRGAVADERAEREYRRERSAGRGCDPRRHDERRSAAAVGVTAGEGDAEEGEAADRDRDAELLAARKRDVRHADAEKREDRNPARSRRLHEGEGRER